MDEVDSAGSAIYNISVTRPTDYPDNTLNCTWEIAIYPYIYNSGTLQPNLFVTPQNLVFTTIPNYKKDNGTPAPGTGTVNIIHPR